MPAHADNDKDKHEDNDKGIRAEIAALQAQVAALQDEVNTLQKANTDQQNEINSLQASNTTLQNQLANAKNVLALDPFVRVDPHPEIGVAGPNIIFSGANIHIESGSGATDDHGNPTGLGNLIIGYDEDPVNYFAGGPGGGIPLSPGDRSGHTTW
jgi:TolA-binding protein